jgi:hypothetical protein
MHAASGTPEEEVILDVLLFSIMALVASISILTFLALTRRKNEA